MSKLQAANPGITYYHSVHNLSSPPLYKYVKIKINKSSVLPLVLYWHQTWSPTLREENRLKAFENRVPMRIFWPKRDEMAGSLRTLHNDVFRNFYSSPSIIRITKSRKIRWAGYVTRLGKSGIHIGFWWEMQKEREHYEDLNISGSG
jgi:hypothetical protein